METELFGCLIGDIEGVFLPYEALKLDYELVFDISKSAIFSI